MVVTKLKIRIYGDPCLRQVCDPIDKIGSSERMLIESMIMTMHAQKGIGLAAPQVGITKRLFVADVGEGPEVFINPKIKKLSGKSVLDEGCLSIPGINVEMTRSAKVTVEYVNMNGKKSQRTCEDLLARVVQHENDHLNGKLIIDYIDPKKLKEVESHLNDLKTTRQGAM